MSITIRALKVCLLSSVLIGAVWSQRAAGQGTATGGGESSGQRAEAQWLRVTPPGEEFSVLTPQAPLYIRYDGPYAFNGDGEKVLERRVYGAHQDDFYFVIDSYRAEKPQALLKEYTLFKFEGAELEREFLVGGFTVKQYRAQSSTVKRFLTATKKHVYELLVVDRAEGSEAVTRFVDSVLLGERISGQATAQAMNVRDSALFKNALSGMIDPKVPGPVFKPKETTRKVRFLWRLEPPYTEQAREKNVQGTVVLQAIFGADGQVYVTKIISGLGSGLTERAVEAALGIRFYPAEKEGRRVSQYVQIEYNFNLY